MTDHNTYFDLRFEDKILPANLTNTIHPYFFPAKFTFPCAGGETISQLFFHMLTESLHIAAAILYGTPTFNAPGAPLLAYFPEPKASAAKLTTEERQATWRRLADLFMGLDFKVETMDSEGRCTSQPGRRTTSFPGCGSTISISADNMEKCNSAFAAGNHMLHQFRMWHVASTLMHELGHSMTYAALPIEYRANCLLGNGQTNEIGFEIQARLFGGLIQEEVNNVFTPEVHNYLPFGIVQREWPFPQTLDLYRVDPNVNTILTRGPETTRLNRSWQVEFSYINQMFQDSYWAKLPAKGPGALEFYRRQGCLFLVDYVEHVDDKPGMSQADPEDPNIWDLVPRGFVMDNSGLIRRDTKKA